MRSHLACMPTNWKLNLYKLAMMVEHTIALEISFGCDIFSACLSHTAIGSDV